MIGHRKCYRCGHIGHKKEMVRESSVSCFANKHWFHRECYPRYLDAFGMEVCGCGKSILWKTAAEDESKVTQKTKKTGNKKKK